MPRSHELTLPLSLDSVYHVEYKKIIMLQRLSREHRPGSQSESVPTSSTQHAHRGMGSPGKPVVFISQGFLLCIPRTRKSNPFPLLKTWLIFGYFFHSQTLKKYLYLSLKEQLT